MLFGLYLLFPVLFFLLLFSFKLAYLLFDFISLFSFSVKSIKLNFSLSLLFSISKLFILTIEFSPFNISSSLFVFVFNTCPILLKLLFIFTKEGDKRAFSVSSIIFLFELLIVFIFGFKSILIYLSINFCVEVENSTSGFLLEVPSVEFIIFKIFSSENLVLFLLLFIFIIFFSLFLSSLFSIFSLFKILLMLILLFSLSS